VVAAPSTDSILATLHAVVQPGGALFIADTFVNVNPDADTLARIAQSAVVEMRRFGVTARVAFLANRTFGSAVRGDTEKMQRAIQRFKVLEPEVSCFDESRVQLGDSAADGINLLICPTLDAANILLNVLKLSAWQAGVVGPVLLGMPVPAHVLAPTASVQRIVDMATVAVSSCVRP
jgi:malate dehydrogenase (oxaloacetate-decarboxylating)(NADP+)